MNNVVENDNNVESLSSKRCRRYKRHNDASWGDLILKIEYLAVKQGKVIIKINPKYSSQECRNCGHTDKSNRDGEKFICTECGYHEHADIGAAKTIRDRGLEIVRGDSAKLAV